jgi:hypothetical protein
MPFQWTNRILPKTFLALTIWLLVGGGSFAQAPFDRLAGQWSGSGTIDMANGAHERIKCRASYDVLSDQKRLQLNIRCASESYNFDLRASAAYSGGAVTGNWSETTRMVAGTILGRADADRIQVIARAASFAASLTLVTHGGRQSVAIRTQDPQSDIRGVSISLRRG